MHSNEKAPSSRHASGQIARSGLMTAVIVLLTTFARIQLPSMKGYAHLGDVGIYIAGHHIGRAAWLPAALGSALADIVSGFTLYAPFTFVIKGIMGYWAGCRFATAENSSAVRWIATSAVLGGIMVSLYAIVDTLIYGWPAALGSIPGNIAQAVVSGGIAWLLRPRFTKPHRCT